VKHGKCVDDEYLLKVFDIEVSSKKDPSQRKACGCVRSKDIGMYDTCICGCLYCYATADFEKARENYRRHDPAGPTLVS
jgi:DNA repair photolyase